ncbi:MAG: AAA family ATPase [Acidobacteria bacterium]|nr:AAA family ATPase [Acidobacteriota bacterium]
MRQKVFILPKAHAVLGRMKKLQFQTAAELAAATPEEVEWVASPWVATGATTELVGKVKAAGKTTWMLALCRAVIEGRQFLGQQTTKTGVVYLTEQPQSSFMEALRRADLHESEDFAILLYHQTVRVTWPQTVTAAVAECNRRRAGLLVVDTLPQFARLRGDAENNSGDALEAVEPLQLAAAESGLAVFYSRHERKRGGTVGDSGRGSSAFAGAVDVVLSLARMSGQGRETLRVLKALSRFSETPTELVIELMEDGTYKARGDNRAVQYEESQHSVLEHLPASAEDAIEEKELRELTGQGHSTLHRVLADLRSAGTVERVGKGKKGDAYRFWAAPVALAGPKVASLHIEDFV